MFQKRLFFIFVFLAESVLSVWPKEEAIKSARAVFSDEDPTLFLHPRAIDILGKPLVKRALDREDFQEPGTEKTDYIYPSFLAPEEMRPCAYYAFALEKIFEERGFDACGLEALSIQGESSLRMKIFSGIPPYMPFSRPVKCSDWEEARFWKDEKEFKGAGVFRDFFKNHPDHSFQLAFYKLFLGEADAKTGWVIFHRPAQEEDMTISMEMLLGVVDPAKFKRFDGLLKRYFEKHIDEHAVRLLNVVSIGRSPLEEMQERLSGSVSEKSMEAFFQKTLKTYKELGWEFCSKNIRDYQKSLVSEFQNHPLGAYLLSGTVNRAQDVPWIQSVAYCFFDEKKDALSGANTADRSLVYLLARAVAHNALELRKALGEGADLPLTKAVYAHSFLGDPFLVPGNESRFEEGKVKNDLTKAHTLAQEAVEAGEPVAENVLLQLTQLDRIEEVLEIDSGKGKLFWMERLARRGGHGFAQGFYGKWLLSNKGTEAEAVEEAFKYLRTAALGSQGEEEKKTLAGLYLGVLDENGNKVEDGKSPYFDPQKAFFWLDRLAFLGDSKAQKAVLYLLKGKVVEQESLYMKRLYDTGVSLRKKAKKNKNNQLYKDAFDLFLLNTLFAENPKAMHNLGSIFHTIKEYQSAHMWFALAAERGLEPSKKNLEEMEKSDLLEQEKKKREAFIAQNPDDPVKYRFRLYLTDSPSHAAPIKVKYDGTVCERFDEEIGEAKRLSDLALMEKYVFGGDRWPNYREISLLASSQGSGIDLHKFLSALLLHHNV